ncbi:Nucleotidyl transferase [Ruminiclostridium papyrosolvens DSM 2782]|uniref:Glucose-1-phosphate thymidylyltransferase n=1 Tax=Ruminiclostridium papyrosolvens DSM 2782 TaxID=588581 RepID=F1TF65_9FIRM|nr:sugar phosphate nucleotidyltransferase [Ruminiclostridium papyrosolvens]EGD47003.1 Nucleotidyl transferase [Ruminiclostridium papyrosolvens DSM 2782]WES33748.1 sugar phosphate nucleotidyltransferase [Ruminiclostridium papyrosolvens DSM 2782]
MKGMIFLDDYEKNLVGIIPAGGFGKRMMPFKMWKELIPVGYKICSASEENGVVPKVVAEYTLENMLCAESKKIVFVINDQKTELLRFFGNGEQYDSNIAYVCQDSKTGFYGLPFAIDAAYMWTKNQTVLMGMPDTINEPLDCFSRLVEVHGENKADLTLGVFPTDHPCRLAPVILDENTGRVLKIYDKPKKTDVFNTWNIAVWSSNFTELLHLMVKDFMSSEQNKKTEMLLSNIFNAAIENGMNVHGVYFPDGRCHDLGTLEDLIKTRSQIEGINQHECY